MEMENNFIRYCTNDYIDKAKKLVFLGVDHTCQDNLAFNSACLFGNIEIAKWLYSLGDVDVNIGFIASCRNGYFPLAQLLWSSNDVSKESLQEAFLYCGLHDMKYTLWVYNLGQIDINKNNDLIFKSCCEIKNISVSKWLFFLNNKFYNNIPDIILNDILKINVFESTQVDLITMYTKLIIS